MDVDLVDGCGLVERTTSTRHDLNRHWVTEKPSHMAAEEVGRTKPQAATRERMATDSERN